MLPAGSEKALNRPINIGGNLSVRALDNGGTFPSGGDEVRRAAGYASAGLALITMWLCNRHLNARLVARKRKSGVPILAITRLMRNKNNSSLT